MATPRKTPPRRATPVPSLTNLLGTPSLEAPDTAVLGALRPHGAGVEDVRVTFYSPAAARVRAPRAPTLTRTPSGAGNPGRGRTPRAACRGTWGLRTPRAQLRSSCSCPPAPPPSSLLVPPLRGSQQRSALASRAACGITSPGPELLGTGRQLQARRVARPLGGSGIRSAPRRAPHCSRWRAGGAGGGRDRGLGPRD